MTRKLSGYRYSLGTIDRKVRKLGKVGKAKKLTKKIRDIDWKSPIVSRLE